MQQSQLSSVQMQVNETLAVCKIEGSISTSISIMKDTNTIVRLPELARTMQELLVELCKAEIIEDMVGESPVQYDLADAEGDCEVDAVLAELLSPRKSSVSRLQVVPADDRNSESCIMA